MTKLLQTLCAIAFGLAAAATPAQDASARRAALIEALQEVRATQVPGPVEVPLRELAALKLGAGYLFVPLPAAGKMLAALGSHVDDSLVGIVISDPPKPWIVTIRYYDMGHIEVGDTKRLDNAWFLRRLREDTEKADPGRAAQGLPPTEVLGWVEAPRYDAATHRLLWAIKTRTVGSERIGVEYNADLLSRHGFLSLGFRTSLEELPKVKPALHAVLRGLRLKKGHRYVDFDPATDKVAGSSGR